MKLISFRLKLTEHSNVKRSILLYSSQQQLKFVMTRRSTSSAFLRAAMREMSK